MNWHQLEVAAPELARPGRERLERVGLAMLGTVRGDGSPRVSPVDPHFAKDELLFGVMSWSGKAHDLRRDPRCALHSATCDPENPEGELKVYGRAREVEDTDVRSGSPKAWWVERPPEVARVFSLEIEEAVFIRWDTEQGVMSLKRWSSEDGLTETERRYP
jgi:Pyridoxamine 5'-phosphate oxidase